VAPDLQKGPGLHGRGGEILEGGVDELPLAVLAEGRQAAPPRARPLDQQPPGARPVPRPWGRGMGGGACRNALSRESGLGGPETP